MAAAKKLYIEYTQVKIKLSIKQYVLVHGSQFISYQKIGISSLVWLLAMSAMALSLNHL